MHDTAQTLQRSASEASALKPLAPRPPVLLTELAGCLMLGTAFVDMWFGIYTLTRAFIYIVAVALAFVGGGCKLRLTPASSLFFVSGGLYIFTALVYPPVPMLVRSDIRNILVGFAFSATLGLSELTPVAWERFQLRAHRTVLVASTLGAVLGLAKLLYYLQGGVIASLMVPDRGYPLGSSLRMDYNFYSLPLLMGVFSCFWLMKHEKSSRWSTMALLCVPTLVLAVLLSGSRRGLLTVILAVPLLSAWLIFNRRKKPTGARRVAIPWKTIVAVGVLATVVCVLNLDAVTRFVNRVTSTDSFSVVMKRWQSFEEGTYADTRMHYWTITLERLARFEPLDYLCGEGFAYVTDLRVDPNLVEDYPHNFLLSSLLYGGLLQTGCLVAMVTVALLGLSRRARGSGILTAWFVLVILFLLTSCNSFFSSEIAIFLTVMGLALKRFGPVQRGVPSIRGQAVHQVRNPRVRIANESRAGTLS